MTRPTPHRVTPDSALERLRIARYVPVLRAASIQDAIDQSSALAIAGFTAIELTFSTPNVDEAIRSLALEDRLFIGVGTVTTIAQAETATDAGADFLVSPIFEPWFVEFGIDHGILTIPGGATPSELFAARLSGSSAVKVFPIGSLGGTSYVRQLLAPLPDLNLMATGGATLAEAPELIAAGCLAVGLGSFVRDASLGSTYEERARRAYLTLCASDFPPNEPGV